MRFVGRAFVLAAFWVPLAICMAVAVTPDPIGVVASLSGEIAHICAFAYLTAALFPAHFRWRRPGLATRSVAQLLPTGRGAARNAAVGASGPAGASDASPARPAESGSPAASDTDASSASPARSVLAAALWMLAFGVVIEVAQLFVAGRSGELADLLPDAAGIALGCVMQSAWPAATRLTASSPP